MIEFSSRIELAKHVFGVGVELGVADGYFSEVLLSFSKLKKLYSIDRWAGDKGHDEKQYQIACAKLRKFGNRSIIIKAVFADVVKEFADETFDFIYIDGYAHTGQEKGETLRNWWPKLKCGGIFAGHDYSSDWPLTVQAVDEFAFSVNKTIQCTKELKWPSWIIRKYKIIS